MAYQHEGFPFAMEHQTHTSVYFHSPQYPPYMLQQPHPDLIYQTLPYNEYADFIHPGMGHEDYDDSGEMSTRPRLTKDQVEVLESQFQAHPKPNSMVKKQLAMQTKLTLPRVANWFQNRRAKAKQQRKQEEYETQQSLGLTEGWKSENNLAARRKSVSESSSKTASPGRQRSSSSSACTKQEPEESTSVDEQTDSKDASWQSLQRALVAAKAAQTKQSQEQAQASLVMPPPGLPRHGPVMHNLQIPFQEPQTSTIRTPVDWSTKQESMNIWSPSPTQFQMNFDFGFDQPPSVPHEDATNEDSMQDAPQFIVSPDDWSPSYVAETTQSQQQTEYMGMLSPPLPISAYSTSRRGSAAEELTANFGTFALQGTPPVSVATVQPTELRPTEGEIDIASRRKRPRPAALTSVSLRSRSYGAISSTSPVFRSGPPSAGQLRLVKSTGHGLNAHYAGIRKSSMPQNSPRAISSFAEAEALTKLVAQRAAVAASKSSQATPIATESSMSGNPNDINMRFVENVGQSLHGHSEAASHYKNLQSPPVTPFQGDFMMQLSGMGMQPSVSASSQFASFADFTPPYSAGPLTNSTCSWSDAPLQSPELPSFPTGTFMSSLGFNHPDSSFQQWVLPSDNMTDGGFNTHTTEEKKTEFYITEFPGQREEHANLAQKLAIQKPKSYVFANTAPSDYDS